MKEIHPIKWRNKEKGDPHCRHLSLTCLRRPHPSPPQESPGLAPIRAGGGPKHHQAPADQAPGALRASAVGCSSHRGHSRASPGSIAGCSSQDARGARVVPPAVSTHCPPAPTGHRGRAQAGLLCLEGANCRARQARLSGI